MSDNPLIRALRSFGQGASNAVAGNVSVPVDGLAWVLRKGGIPIPQNPVGGSDWMAQQGLTAKPQNAIAGLLGETAGMVGPALMQAAAPKIAGGLLALDDHAMEMARRGVEGRMVNSGMLQPATVYHGSPHKFDKFDSSKIGTGEGAQAYGHGLYLAESPGVAGSYQKMLSQQAPVSFSKEGRLLEAAPDIAETFFKPGRKLPGFYGLERVHGFKKNADGSWVAELARDRPAWRGGAARTEYRKVAELPGEEELIKALTSDGYTASRGSLYKVDLPDDAIAKMLDWDKPLSQQAPEVRSALNELGMGGSAAWDEITGLNLFSQVGQRSGGKDISKAASEALLAKGIPGIRYLDGGSRGAGGGTSNYVVFPGNESLLTILERNGVPIK
jgi:hypothetical protein